MVEHATWWVSPGLLHNSSDMSYDNKTAAGPWLRHSLGRQLG